MPEHMGPVTRAVDTSSSDAGTHIADTSAAHAASAVSANSTTLVGTGTDVQAVLEELDNGVADHLADTSAAHAASAISTDSTTLVGTGTDVQAVLEELDNGVADHLADAADAHAGTAITYTAGGGIVATTVQAAVAELDTEAAKLAGAAFTGLLSSTNEIHSQVEIYARSADATYQMRLGYLGIGGKPGLEFGSGTSLHILSGTGDPNGVVAAAVGSLYLRKDGGANTALYVKEVGADNMGWQAK